MKIGILSDIHIDINYTDRDLITPAICRNINKKSLDMIIVAGEIGRAHV